MELKGSKTEANLWEAFAGESQARNKYTYYASKARKEGFEQIAAFSNWILPWYQEAMTPVDSLGYASLAFSAADVTLRVIVLYQMFSGSYVPVWLECRRDMRRRKDLALELALFGASVLLLLLLVFLPL